MKLSIFDPSLSTAFNTDTDKFVKTHWIHKDGTVTGKNFIGRLCNKWIVTRALYRKLCGINLNQTIKHLENKKASTEEQTFNTTCDLLVAMVNKMNTKGKEKYKQDISSLKFSVLSTPLSSDDKEKVKKQVVKIKKEDDLAKKNTANVEALLYPLLTPASGNQVATSIGQLFDLIDNEEALKTACSDICYHAHIAHRLENLKAQDPVQGDKAAQKIRNAIPQGLPIENSFKLYLETPGEEGKKVALVVRAIRELPLSEVDPIKSIETHLKESGLDSRTVLKLYIMFMPNRRLFGHQIIETTFTSEPENELIEKLIAVSDNFERDCLKNVSREKQEDIALVLDALHLSKSPEALKIARFLRNQLLDLEMSPEIQEKCQIIDPYKERPFAKEIAQLYITNPAAVPQMIQQKMEREENPAERALYFAEALSVISPEHILDVINLQSLLTRLKYAVFGLLENSKPTVLPTLLKSTKCHNILKEVSQLGSYNAAKPIISVYVKQMEEVGILRKFLENPLKSLSFVKNMDLPAQEIVFKYLKDLKRFDSCVAEIVYANSVPKPEQEKPYTLPGNVFRPVSLDKFGPTLLEHPNTAHALSALKKPEDVAGFIIDLTNFLNRDYNPGFCYYVPPETRNNKFPPNSVEYEERQEQLNYILEEISTAADDFDLYMVKAEYKEGIECLTGHLQEMLKRIPNVDLKTLVKSLKEQEFIKSNIFMQLLCLRISPDETSFIDEVSYDQDFALLLSQINDDEKRENLLEARLKLFNGEINRINELKHFYAAFLRGFQKDPESFFKACMNKVLSP